MPRKLSAYNLFIKAHCTGKKMSLAQAAALWRSGKRGAGIRRPVRRGRGRVVGRGFWDDAWGGIKKGINSGADWISNNHL